MHKPRRQEVQKLKGAFMKRTTLAAAVAATMVTFGGAYAQTSSDNLGNRPYNDNGATRSSGDSENVARTPAGSRSATNPGGVLNRDGSYGSDSRVGQRDRDNVARTPAGSRSATAPGGILDGNRGNASGGASTQPNDQNSNIARTPAGSHDAGLPGHVEDHQTR
jgi:hypothetical protein